MTVEGFAIQDDTGGLYVKLEEKLSFGLGARPPRPDSRQAPLGM
ncbi:MULTISPECIES: hypothetical protein [Corallococcus]|nr:MULTISPECIES: hypothetical protein [Corallococcus]